MTRAAVTENTKTPMAIPNVTHTMGRRGTGSAEATGSPQCPGPGKRQGGRPRAALPVVDASAQPDPLVSEDHYGRFRDCILDRAAAGGTQCNDLICRSPGRE